MSLKSWKSEFYRTPAGKVPRSKATAHSLRKWEGLTEANLEKHGLCKESFSDGIRNAAGTLENVFYIDDASCALCQAFRESDDDYVGCRPCPLYKVLQKPCYDGDSSPYQRFVATGNPQRMILALKKAAKIRVSAKREKT